MMTKIEAKIFLMWTELSAEKFCCEPPSPGTVQRKIADNSWPESRSNDNGRENGAKGGTERSVESKPKKAPTRGGTSPSKAQALNVKPERARAFKF